LKIQIKRNLIIFEDPYEWTFVRDQVKKDFGDQIFAISWRLKRELGFTVRHHKALVPWHEDSTRFSYADQIHLDFYNESMLSWFVLKYVNAEGPLEYQI
jgi:hypothetical protein